MNMARKKLYLTRDPYCHSDYVLWNRKPKKYSSVSYLEFWSSGRNELDTRLQRAQLGAGMVGQGMSNYAQMYGLRSQSQPMNREALTVSYQRPVLLQRLCTAAADHFSSLYTFCEETFEAVIPRSAHLKPGEGFEVEITIRKIRSLLPTKRAKKKRGK